MLWIIGWYEIWIGNVSPNLALKVIIYKPGSVLGFCIVNIIVIGCIVKMIDGGQGKKYNTGYNVVLVNEFLRAIPTDRMGI